MAEGERTIENTPSWALAAVCAVFVIIGVFIVFVIDQIEKRLKRAHRKPLVQSIANMKEELMQLGFISLLLVLFQSEVEKICIKNSVLDLWNPCPAHSDTSSTPAGSGRRLLSGPAFPEAWYMNSGDGRPLFTRRNLAEFKSKCGVGYSSIVSKDTLHELHIYLFILACVHIAYSLLGMAISIYKMKRMRDWEDLAQLRAREIDDIRKSPLVTDRNRSFVEHHLSNPLSRNSYSVWIVCFFRQFTHSVTKSDYLTLRQGFIATHGLGTGFDFHGYLVRSLEDELPSVVGISPFLWGVFLVCLLFNTYATNLYFWVSLIPLVVLLIVGTKLQHVIATLALDNAGISHHGRYSNAPLAPRDDLFWFNRPEIILFLIHYIIFQTAFEMATFIGYIWAFGIDSCALSRKQFVYSRLALSAVVFLVCAYHILPLYAVVIQMGSHASPAVNKQLVQDKIKNWRKEARKRARKNSNSVHDEGSVVSIETISEEDGSVVGTMHGHDGTQGKSVDRPTDLEMFMFSERRSKSTHAQFESSHEHPLWSHPNSRVYRTSSEPLPDVLPMIHVFLPPENSLQLSKPDPLVPEPEQGKK